MYARACNRSLLSTRTRRNGRSSRWGFAKRKFAKIHPAESEKVECTGTRSAY